MSTVPQNGIVCGMQETPQPLFRNAMYLYSMAVCNLIDICISNNKTLHEAKIHNCHLLPSTTVRFTGVIVMSVKVQ